MSGGFIILEEPEGAAAAPQAARPTSGFEILEEPAPAPGVGEAVRRGVEKGFTFGFGDEAKAAAAASRLWGSEAAAQHGGMHPFDVVAGAARLGLERLGIGSGASAAYDRQLRQERAADAAAQEAYPWTSAAANLAGSAFNPATWTPIGAATRAAQAGRAAKTGFGLGAVYGFGEGEGDALSRLASGGIAGAVGAVGGGVIGGALPALARAPNAVQDALAGLDMTAPRFITSDSPVVQATAIGAKQVPFVGPGMIGKSAERFGEQLSGKVGEIADEIGGQAAGMDRSSLGGHVRSLVENAIGSHENTNDAAFNMVRNVVDTKRPVKEAQEPLRQTIGNIIADRMEAGEGSSLGKLEAVSNLMREPAGVTFDGLQRARSQLGRAIRFDARNGGFEAGDLKRAYGAVTEAMERAVAASAKGDPAEAVQAWKAADAIFARNVDVLHSLDKAIANPSDERLINQIVGMASEKTGDAKRMYFLHQQLGPEGMQAVGAHILDRAGVGPQGEWSAARFSTAIGQLSATSKKMLFGPAAPAVDKLNTVAARWASIENRYANKSNTAGAIALSGAGGAAASALLNADDPMDMLKRVAQGAGTAAGVVGIAAYLRSPALANQAANTAQAWVNARAAGSVGAKNAFFALQRRLSDALTREAAPLMPRVTRSHSEENAPDIQPEVEPVE